MYKCAYDLETEDETLANKEQESSSGFETIQIRSVTQIYRQDRFQVLNQSYDHWTEVSPRALQ